MNEATILKKQNRVFKSYLKHHHDDAELLAFIAKYGQRLRNYYQEKKGGVYVHSGTIEFCG